MVIPDVIGWPLLMPYFLLFVSLEFFTLQWDLDSLLYLMDSFLHDLILASVQSIIRLMSGCKFSFSWKGSLWFDILRSFEKDQCCK